MPEEKPESKAVHDEADIIDGGTVSGPLIEGGTVQPLENVEVRSRRVRETTARTLALSLVAILALSGLMHYVGVFVLVLADKTAAVEELNRFFHAWLPVISGLVGSAVTYYFTKERS